MFVHLGSVTGIMHIVEITAKYLLLLFSLNMTFFFSFPPFEQGVAGRSGSDGDVGDQVSDILQVIYLLFYIAYAMFSFGPEHDCE